MAANAAAVSRALKAAGITTSHADRRFKHEGVFVSQSMQDVAVDVDMIASSQRRRIVVAVVEALTAKGYDCCVAGERDDIVYASKEG